MHDPSYIFGPIINQIEVNNANTWYALVKDFLKLGIIPQDMNKMECHNFKQKYSKYTLLGDILYKCGYKFIILKFLEPNEIPFSLSQPYDGTFGGHFSGMAIAK